MQNKKVTMLAAVLAVTVVAMAGVGYAIQYTATTSNTNNSMGTTYLTLTQDQAAQYDSKSFLTDLYFDSVNDKESTKYTPVLTGKINEKTYEDATEGTTVAKISNALQLKLQPSASNNATSINLLVTIKEPLTLNPKLTFTMVLQGKGTADYKLDNAVGTQTVAGWYFTNLVIEKTALTTFDVVLVAKLADNTESLLSTEANTGFPPVGDIDKCEFDFKAIASA